MAFSLPHPFQPSPAPAWPQGLLRLVIQQPKLKFPKADNSTSLSEAACRKGILIHLGLLALTPQPSLTRSLAIQVPVIPDYGVSLWSQNTSASLYQDVLHTYASRPSPHS